MPALDSGVEQLTPVLPRRFAMGARLIPAMAILAAASLAIAVEPGIPVLDDHAWQFNGDASLTCFDGSTLSASSEVITDVVAYWNDDAGLGQIIAVDGEEALTSAGADAPTDADILDALPAVTFPWVRLGRVKFARDAGTVITIAQIDHTVRALEIGPANKATGQASSSHDDDPIGTAELYEYAGELAFEVDAADIGAADVVTDYPLPLFHGALGRIRAIVTKAITTGAKAATVSPEIGAVGVTGGDIALAGAYAIGAVQEGTAITALHTFKPGSTLSLVGSGITAFAEGRVKLVVELYRLVF